VKNGGCSDPSVSNFDSLADRLTLMHHLSPQLAERPVERMDDKAIKVPLKTLNRPDPPIPVERPPL
jgi:hypothetical protein